MNELQRHKIAYGMDFDKGIRATRVEVQYMTDSEGKTQILDIHTEDTGAGMYFTLNTTTGFSFNDKDELMSVIDDFIERVGDTNHLPSVDYVEPEDDDDDEA